MEKYLCIMSVSRKGSIIYDRLVAENVIISSAYQHGQTNVEVGSSSGWIFYQYNMGHCLGHLPEKEFLLPHKYAQIDET